MMPRRLLIFLAMLGVAAAAWSNAAKLACAGTVLSAVLNGVVDRFHGFAIRYYWDPPAGSWTPRTLAPEEEAFIKASMHELAAAKDFDEFMQIRNRTKESIARALRGQLLPTEREDCSNPDMPLQAPTTAPDVVPMQAPTTAPVVPMQAPTVKPTPTPSPSDDEASDGNEADAGTVAATAAVVAAFRRVDRRLVPASLNPKSHHITRCFTIASHHSLFYAQVHAVESERAATLLACLPRH